MEQRPLRLGDIVDDYCPRERRLTNHAIVVMAGTDIQHTRCTTCDTEHPFKKGKVPVKKARENEPPRMRVAQPAAAAAHEPVGVLVEEPPVVLTEDASPAAVAGDLTAASAGEATDGLIAEPANDAEPAWTHRPLIRASLPRLEGQPPPQPQRQGPEFTMRQLGRRHRDQGRWNGSRSRHSR